MSVPAKMLTQSGEVKKLFREKILKKKEQRKERLLKEVDDELPKWLSWALKPVASATQDLIETRDGIVGKIGEIKASTSLRVFLPSDCILINDVVLEPEPEEFIQVDHIILAPGGVFLVETKAWQGAVLCKKGVWMRKEGEAWVRVQSPLAQNLRHARLFRRWVYSAVPGLPDGDWVKPVVVFTRASWLRVEDDTMPVYDGCLQMAWQIRKTASAAILEESDRERIAAAILEAKPFPVVQGQCTSLSIPADPSIDPASVEEGQTREGRRYVRVRGTKQEAEGIRLRYATRGFRPGELKGDRYESGVWFFYLE